MAKFFQKLKDFGSKVISKIKTGADKAMRFARKILPVVKTVGPVIAAAVGHPEVGEGIAKGSHVADQILTALGR